MPQQGGHTQEEAVAWARAQIGKYLDYDGYYGCQCVDLIAYYYQYLGNQTPGGNACDYAYNVLPSGWTRIQNTPTFVPEPGDIVVWNDQGWDYGHVAIFLSGDTHSFTSIDQNWPRGTEVTEVYHSNYNYVWGVIRPDFQTDRLPIGHFDTVDSPAPNKVHVTGWALDWDDLYYSLGIHVYIGGEAGTPNAECHSIMANTYRSDVNEAKGVGGNRGFDATISTGKTGTQSVYVYAINIGGGVNPCLGSMTVNIQSVPTNYQDIGADFYGTIITGQYKLVSVDTSGNVVQMDIKDSRNQIWHFVRNSDLSYTITNLENGKCLDVSGKGTANQTNVISSASNGGDNQKWYFIKQDGDFYSLVPKHARGMALDVDRASTDHGANIQIYEFNNTQAQKYRPYKFSTYTVSYNMNGGTGSIPSQLKVHAQYVILSSTKPTRTGYTFVGWNTNKDATTAQYQPGDKYTVNSNATLYAIWKANTYTISYNMNGGSGSIGNQTKTYGQDLTLSSTKPTRTGYTFVGWNTNKDATTAQYQLGDKYTANSGATLYAIWTLTKPSATTVSVIAGNSTTPTAFSWTKTDNTKTYNLKIWKDKLWDGDAFVVKSGLTDLSCYVELPAGYYEAYVDAVNDNGWTTSTNVVKFTIAESTAKAKGTYNGHTYEYYDQALNWNQAYKFCERKGGHLVTITSKEENDFIVELTKSRSANLWTGGITSDYQKWYWINGEPFDYQNWATGEPNNINGGQDTIKVFLEGTWDDETSSKTCEFVCEYDNGVDAEKYSPVIKENYNGHEYWFFEDSVDWQTAKRICEEKGGYLAIPNDADENTFILSDIKQTVWIGITDIAQEGIWKDVKGNSLTYTNWASGEPNNCWDIEDYAEIYSDGTWNDVIGHVAILHNFGFICEFDDLCTGSGHDYKEEVIAPTTTSKGYTLHTCSKCGHTYKDSYTDMLMVNTTTLSAVDVKLGTYITVNASATGGTAPYQYAYVAQAPDGKWYVLKNYSTDSTHTCKPASTGKYTVQVKVKDSAGTVKIKSFTLNVSNELANNSTLSAAKITKGQSVTMTAKAVGGTAPYQYAYVVQSPSGTWTVLKGFSTAASHTWTPASLGNYTVQIKVKDSAGTVKIKSFTLNVSNELANTSTLSASKITKGQSVTMTAKALGGTAPYQYAYVVKSPSGTWTVLKGFSTAASHTWTPASLGNYTVQIKVKDSAGTVKIKNFNLTVSA